MADDPRRKQARCSFRDKRQIDEGRPEQAAAGSDRQVAMEVECRADTDCQTIDAGDERLFGQCQRLDEQGAGRRLRGSRHGITDEIAHVVAGGKTAFGAEKHDGLHLVIGIGLFERRRHALIHGRGDGVLLFRPVEADDQNAGIGVGTLDDDMFGQVNSSIRDDPPLACRPSPPQGGRRPAAPSPINRSLEAAARLSPSPLWGGVGAGSFIVSHPVEGILSSPAGCGRRKGWRSRR
ncbi:hypothetical protein D3C73_868000 [compost metagenome]